MVWMGTTQTYSTVVKMSLVNTIPGKYKVPPSMYNYPSCCFVQAHEGHEAMTQSQSKMV